MAGPAQRLLAWYDAVRRPLPWRRDRDPYRVWVAEVMLQQTRVETVVRHFERFLARFPDARALAAAPRDEVLAAWSGLGYYRRARDLHRAAQSLGAAGRIPRRSAELLRLPGVGAYTAAAVASIAFGEVVPVLDGNVERVTARLGAIAGDPKRAAARRRLRAVAADLLDPRRPGDSNQALMELGATVCLPRAPRCPRCPLRRSCRARAQGAVERFPTRRRRAPARRVRAVAAVVESPDGRVLLLRRGEDAALLPGTWEVPWIEIPASTAAAELDQVAVGELASRYGGVWRLGPRRAVVGHAITTRALRVEVRAATLDDGGDVAEGVVAGWFSSRDRRALPRSALVDKILG